MQGRSGARLPASAAAAPGAATGKIVFTAEDAVEHGKNGLLVPPGDARALAGAMGRLVDDAGLRQRLGQQAKADFDDHLNYAHFYAQIKTVYEE